jgi:hypothetical protein
MSIARNSSQGNTHIITVQECEVQVEMQRTKVSEKDTQLREKDAELQRERALLQRERSQRLAAERALTKLRAQLSQR